MTLPPLDELVPHRRGMLLLERLVSVEPRRACAELRIGTANRFGGADGVAAWVGIEYMAQTIAALAGWNARRRGQPVRIGYLLGTRRYVPRVSHFRPGQVLRVCAEEDYIDDSGMARFRCTIHADADRPLVEAALTVYQPADAPLASDN